MVFWTLQVYEAERDCVLSKENCLGIVPFVPNMEKCREEDAVSIYVLFNLKGDASKSAVLIYGPCLRNLQELSTQANHTSSKPPDQNNTVLPLQNNGNFW
jgi:hypothetical protein